MQKKLNPHLSALTLENSSVSSARVRRLSTERTPYSDVDSTLRPRAPPTFLVCNCGSENTNLQIASFKFFMNGCLNQSIVYAKS